MFYFYAICSQSVWNQRAKVLSVLCFVTHSHSFHTTSLKVFHLHQATQNIAPTRLIKYRNQFSLKTLKRWPFKAIAAFVVAQCTIHNELCCEGHDKWIMLCLFVWVLEILKSFKRAWINTRKKKKKKEEQLLHNIALDWTDSRACWECGMNWNPSQTCKKDEWPGVIMYSCWKLSKSTGADAWQLSFSVLHWQLYDV